MPKLGISKQRPSKELASLAIPIDMNAWGSSSEKPLATWGAGPCLNVVIHRGSSGVLAHVGQYSTVKDIGYPEMIHRVELYHKVCFTVRDMLIHGLHYLKGFEIWLGAGGAFVPNSFYAKENDSVLYDLPEYLKRFLVEVGCTDFKIYDCRKQVNSGDILYNPTTGTIYMLSEQEDIFAIQNESNKPAQSGKCY
jgi:hypothetical protein